MSDIRHSLQNLADALSPDTGTSDGFVDNVETSLARISQALPKKLGGKIEAESLADEYDDQATYGIGDYCTHDGVFYICATAIAIAESWNSAKWVAVPIIEILQEKLNAPADGAVAGRYLMVGQNGEPVWDQLDESDIRQSVYDWMSAHPEAIVVNDGTITRAKLDSSVGRAVDEVSELKADFFELVVDGNNQNLFSVVQSFEGNCLNANGDLGYDQPDNITSDYISISGATSVTLQTWHTLPENTVNWQAFCFYDAQKNLVGSRNVKTGSTDSHVVFTLSVPTGAVYVRVSSRIFGDYKVMLQYGDTPTAYVENTYDSTYIHGLSELTYDEYKGYIAAGGEFVAPNNTSQEVFTDPIKCLEGDVIYYSIYNPGALSSWFAYCTYDADGVFINRIVILPSGTYKSYSSSVTIPSGVSYVRFTYRTYGGDIKLTLRGNRQRNNTYQYKLNRAFTKVEHLIPMIPSLYHGLPRFDTVAKTLTIPSDTLLMFHGYAPRGIIYVPMPETIVDFSSIASSAIKFYFNIDSKTVRAIAYNYAGYDNEVMLCCFRRLEGGGGHASMSIPYYVDGELYGFDFNELMGKDLSSFNKNVKSINHRGYNTVAPENTLPAYQLSKKNGFDMVETDVSFTSDNVAVLLHDDTINRTARNSDGTEISETISINSITYAEASTYDFGIWKGNAYAGTKIPTFEQFISLCRKIGLHPYIELKSAGVTQSNIQGLVDIVKSYDMLDKVTWISFNATFLGYVKQYDPTARLGVVCGAVTESIITNAVNLKTQDNDVFIDASDGTDNDVSLAKTAELPIEVWGINTANGLNALDGYVSGATANKLVFGYELYKANV